MAWNTPALAQLAAQTPAGVWHCLIMSPGGVAEQTILLRFTTDAPVAVATPSDSAIPLWRELSSARHDGRNVFFTDPGTEQRFEGFFNGDGITGLWRTSYSLGEWWCAAVDAPGMREAQPATAADPKRFPFPHAIRLATPRYPYQAIRAGLEGRVVACFQVDAAGGISEARILEGTDSIFREPTLEALTQSFFKPWPDGEGQPPRPACRTYTFQLEPDY